MRSLWIVLALATLQPACSSRDLREPTGCYALQLQPWEPAIDVADAGLFVPPATFELLADSANGPWYPAGSRRALPPPERESPELNPRAYWQKQPSDSLSVTWTDGFTGFEARFAQHGDTLDGWATAFADGHPTRLAISPALAVRTPCP